MYNNRGSECSPAVTFLVAIVYELNLGDVLKVPFNMLYFKRVEVDNY